MKRGRGGGVPQTSRGPKNNVDIPPTPPRRISRAAGGAGNVALPELCSPSGRVTPIRSPNAAHNRQDPRKGSLPLLPGSPTPLRLRTPSPDRHRRTMHKIDRQNEAHKDKMKTLMSDLMELRNTQGKMKAREAMKVDMRFTELPTPVYNPPPKSMPRNSEAVQRVLDRRALEVGAVLHKESRRMVFDSRLQLIAYDHPADVGVQAGGWGFGNAALMDALFPDKDAQPDISESDDPSVAFTLESVADSLSSVAMTLIDSVSLNDSWRFFRRTGGNGVEWTHEDAIDRRMRLPNPFQRLVLAPWHAAGNYSSTLDMTLWHVDDDSLRVAASSNPYFVSMILKGCESLSAQAMGDALASRGPGLIQLDISNGVRGVTELLRPKPAPVRRDSESSDVSTMSSNSLELAHSKGDTEGKSIETKSVAALPPRVDAAVREERLAAAFRTLSWISLTRCPALSAQTIGLVCLRCPILRYLDISCNSDSAVDDAALRYLAAGAGLLETLKVDRSRSITDEGLRTVISRCRRLLNLHASYCPQLQGKFFLHEPAHSNAPSRVVVKCGRLQHLDLQHCEDLDPFTLSWAGSSAQSLRTIIVSGTPAGNFGPALFALCSCVKRLERLDIESMSNPHAHDGHTGYLGKPMKSGLLISALLELSPMSGLLELVVEELSDDDLFTLLVFQGKLLRVLKLAKAPRLRGSAFARLLTNEPETHTPGAVESHIAPRSVDENGWEIHGADVAQKRWEAAEAAAATVPKQRLVDREGEEPPFVPGGPFLGQLQSLTLGGMHALAPHAFESLAQLGLQSLTNLDISGLRGGAKRHAGALGSLLRVVGKHLTHLRLADCIIDDNIAAAISDGCSAHPPPRQGAMGQGFGGLGGRLGGHGLPAHGLHAAPGSAEPLKPNSHHYSKPRFQPKNGRVYTTVEDLPALRSLKLEYIADPKVNQY